MIFFQYDVGMKRNFSTTDRLKTEVFDKSQNKLNEKTMN